MASASWSRPVRFGGPWSLDVLPAQIAFSPAGAAAIGYGLQDADNPSSASALLTTRIRGRLSGPRQVPGAQAILALAFDATGLELLTGASPVGESCCSSAQAVRLAGASKFWPPRTVAGGLTGSTLGRLVPLTGGGMLAAIATERGVWAAQAQKPDRFGAPRRLTAAGDRPQTLAATSLGGGRTAIAWTATSGSPGGPGPRSISIATGTRSRAPRSGATAVTVPSAHEIDELEIGSGRSVPTVAWIESWFDRAGRYHSQPVAKDVSRGTRPRVFAPGSKVASRLAFASDAKGDQVIAWEVCDSSGACALQAATRPAGGRFGPPASLGPIDASQSPAATIGPAGDVLVGWIDPRGVVIAGRPATAARFGSPKVIWRTTLAADLALASAPGGGGIAAWTQGTLSPTLMGAVDHAQ